jgi:Nitrogen permease regulator 2
MQPPPPSTSSSSSLPCEGPTPPGPEDPVEYDGPRPKTFELRESLQHLAQPRSPAKCQLLGCFYAEFDIQVGPKICFESPKGLMSKDVSTPVDKLEMMLTNTFSRNNPATPITTCRKKSDRQVESAAKSGTIHEDHSEMAVDSSPNNTDASIFASCSEYIIPGSDELTGNIISLSTSHFHILSRPTIIHDEKYARNALLFSVGFVIRQDSDPRPFKPVLSKIALTLQEMETEAEYLTRNRSEFQSLMDGLLISLNGDESNLLLGKADFLNLKLFRPPRIAAPPVKDHEVPVLLRHDWQQTYDWDLAIIWVSRHIDGIANAKQISISAEVDMEMVRACLRVLRHHKVIAVVDMFFYTNRYECTEKGLKLSKNFMAKESALLNEAVAFVVRRQAFSAKETGENADDRSDSSHGSSPSGRNSASQRPQASSDLSKETLFSNPRTGGTFNSSVQETMQMTLSSLDPQLLLSLKAAIANFYFTCNRRQTFGDSWISLIASSQQKTETRKIFRLLDHRRLATFGIVHGLITRVRGYPLLVSRPAFVNNKIESPSILHRWPQEPVSTQQSKHTREEEAMLKKECASALMDGDHCDDEIVCAVGLCISDIMAFYGTGDVMTVYSISVED